MSLNEYFDVIKTTIIEIKYTKFDKNNFDGNAELIINSFEK